MFQRLKSVNGKIGRNDLDLCGKPEPLRDLPFERADNFVALVQFGKLRLGDAHDAQHFGRPCPMGDVQ